MKQFFLQGEIDGVPVRWLVLRSTDGAVTWLDEHLVQEVVSSTWATTTFSDLEVKEATDPMPNVGRSHRRTPYRSEAERSSLVMSSNRAWGSSDNTTRRNRRRSYKTPWPRRARPGLTVLRRGSASPPIQAECSTGVNARRSLGDRSPTAAIAITNAIDRDGDQVFRQQDRHEQAQGLAVRLKANRYRRFAPCDRCGVPRRSSACRRNRSSISV